MSNRPLPLLIAANADAQTGAGHVMRTLALAQAWQYAGGEVSYVMKFSDPRIGTILRENGIVVHEVEGTLDDQVNALIELGHVHQAKWLVLDGYDFDSNHQRHIKESGFSLLYLDDLAHLDCYAADIVLNQNLHASARMYEKHVLSGNLLLGPHYGMLRSEFQDWRDWNRSIPPVARQLLVTTGGGDVGEFGFKVIDALSRTTSADLLSVLTIGGTHPDPSRIQRAVESAAESIQVAYEPANMAKLMAAADMAVASSGSTALELLFMGLPSIVFVAAENQRSIAEYIQGTGVGINLGWHENVNAVQIAREIDALAISPQLREQFADAGRKLVDGFGVYRVLEAMGVIVPVFRRVQQSDCELIWKWANDSMTRAVSFSSAAISWQEHNAWFHAKMTDPNCDFSVVMKSGNTPMGVVRCEFENNEGLVSIVVDPEFRGKGYGSQIIRLACKRMFQQFRLNKVHAYVKSENSISLRAFQKAGFTDSERVSIKGQPAHHFIAVCQNDSI